MTVRTAAEGGEYKTKLLRAILACQQGLAMLFESSRQDASANRTFQEILSAEFSKLRRYVQLLGCLTSELRIFISSNNKEYSKAEFKTLWMHTTDKGAHDALQDFSGFWKTTKVFSSSEIPEELRDTTSAVEYSMNN
jgi:hypothetical protein